MAIIQLIPPPSFPPVPPTTIPPIPIPPPGPIVPPPVPIPKQPFTLTQTTVTWSAEDSQGVDLFNNKLTVVTADNNVSNRGSTIKQQWAQLGGTIYWEITWAAMLDNTLPGGLGIASPGVGFGAFAANGAGGVLLRPNGDIYVNGVQIDSSGFFKQQVNDTIGFLLNFNNSGIITLNFYGAAGSVLGKIAGAGFANPNLIPPGLYVPVVVFDNSLSFEVYEVTANFGANGGASFLGPVEFKDTIDWNNITLGWPAQIVA